MTANFLNLPGRWASAWSSSDVKAWLELYALNSQYTDHAFRITRVGHQLLKRHHSIWRAAIPDFILHLDPAQPVWWRNIDENTASGHCSFRTINRGTFQQDLPSKKASGQTFEFSAVVDLVVDNGLITKVDEWYTIEFDKSVPIAQYQG